MNRPLSSRDLEILSAYLDKQLTSGEQRRLEERLSTTPALKAALDDLRRTRAMLRSLPKVRAPRNFTLSPSMVPARKRKPGWGISLSWSQSIPDRPARSAVERTMGWGVSLSWSAASALATLLLVIIFVGDFLGYFSPLRSLQTAERPMEALALETAMSELDQQAKMAEQPAAQELEQTIPLVAENTRGMGGGGGGPESSAPPQATIQADLLLFGTPQPELAQPALGFEETLTLTMTQSMADTMPGQVMTMTTATPSALATEMAMTSPAGEQQAEPIVLEQESPQPSQVVFTPLWVRLVEIALLLVAIGAALFAVLRQRML